MKFFRIIALCLLLANSNSYAQISYTFEDSSLYPWEFDGTDAWNLSADRPLNGSYSLKHVFDNTQNGEDKAALFLHNLKLDYDTTVWEFKLRYGYSPSSSNNWAIYLLAESNVQYLSPSQTNNAYLLGVNQTGSNDTLYFYRQNGTNISILANLGINWQNNISIDSIAHLKIIRTPEGFWNFYINVSKSEPNWQLLVETENKELMEGEYFGIYYQYTKTQDQKFWFDDLVINGYFEIDTIGPKIDSIKVINANTLQIFFDEEPVVDTIPSVDSIFVNVSNKTDTIIVENKIWEIIFTEDFLSKPDNELIIKNITDKKGNASDLNYTFFYYRPEFHDIIINEIFADPFPPEDLPEYEFIEIKNVCDYTLNLQNWKLEIETKTYTFPEYSLLPDSFLIITNSSGLGEYSALGNTLALLSSTTTLKNLGSYIKLITNNNDISDSLCYESLWYGDNEKSTGGWSLERLRTDTVCKPFSNWRASLNVLGGTPGKNNSQKLPIDTISPLVNTIIQTPQNNLLQFTFSETVDSDLLLKEEIKISGNSVDSIIHVNDTLYELISKIPFENSRTYTILFEELTDYCENTTKNSEKLFIPYYGNAGDIIINELMIDPSPSVALPEYEYVELFNASAQTVNLKNWKLKANSAEWILPNIELPSGEYLLITHKEAANLFSSEINKLGLFTSGYSLSNEQSSIVLSNAFNQVIDSVYYNVSEIPSSKNISGGVSIERNKFYDLCANEPFWVYSENANSGTPGFENSTPLDRELILTIDSFWIDNPEKITVAFNKPFIFDSTQLPNIVLNGEHSAYARTQEEQKISFTFNTVFEIGENELTLTGFSDFCYNNANDTALKFQYNPALPLDLIVTELMIDPSPSVALPEYEYVELFNASAQIVNLKNWKLKANSAEWILPNIELPSGEYLLITHKEAANLFSSEINKLGLFTSGYSLSNEQSSVVLTNAFSQVIDSVYYNVSEIPFSNNISGGVSIERNKFYGLCANEPFWVYSENENGGTPGFENSTPLDKEITLTVDTFWIDNPKRLTVAFNKPFLFDSTQLPNIVLNGEHSAYARTQEEQRISFTFNPVFEIGGNELTLTGFSDFCHNNADDTALKFQYNPVLPLDLIITELMIDPSPSLALPEYEYVELFNASAQTVNLKNWKLKANSAEWILPNIELPSGKYLLITHNEAVSLFNPDINIVGLFTSGYNLSNEQSSVVLTNAFSQVIDSVYYNVSEIPSSNNISGGVSIERNKFYNSCINEPFWVYSENENGGTPGFENSTLLNKEIILTVDTFWIDNPKRLTVAFNKPFIFDSTQLPNIVLNGEHSAYARTQEEQKISFTFNTVFEIGENELTLTGFSDFCYNNANDTALKFQYNPALPLDLIITELMIDPSPSLALPEYEYVELFNASAQTVNLKNWKLKANSAEWILPNIELPSGKYLLITHNEAVSLFSSEINKLGLFTSGYSLSNEQSSIVLSNAFNQIIDSVYYNVSEIPFSNNISGGVSIERNKFYGLCANEPFWVYSENENGGTPGFENSTPLDKEITLTVDTFWIDNPDKITVAFNKPFLFDSTQLPNIVLNGEHSAYARTQEEQRISFTFNTVFEIGGNELALTGFSDFCHNNANDTVLKFQYNPVLPLNIIATEIMFAPSDETDINAEYIEVYNNTTRVLFLDTLEIKISSRTAQAYNFSIRPNKYLVIGDIDNATEFRNIENLLLIDNFPSIPNEASTVNLLYKDTKIFSVDYNIDWYDKAKSDGGWAIELIDFNNLCNNRNGWSWSANASGGTPGKANNPEPSAFFQENASIRIVPGDNAQAILYFSECVWTDTFYMAPKLTFEPALKTDNIYIDNFSNTAEITFPQQLKAGKEYWLTDVKGFFNCQKEEIVLENPVKFQLSGKPLKNDILISEVLFDVTRDNEQFIEIYNNAKDPFDISELNVSLKTDTVKRFPFSRERYLLWPEEYAVVTRDKYNILRNYDAIYPNRILENNMFNKTSGDNIYASISTDSNLVIDEFNYSEQYHIPLYSDFKGISLERVSFNQSTNEKTNWHSASQLAGFATPGYENSQHNEDVPTENNEITLEYKVFSPDNDGYRDMLPVQFNLGHTQSALRVDIYDSSGRLVRRLSEQATIENAGTLYWDGVNFNGEIAPTGIYLVVASYYNLEGKQKIVRLAAVLGKRF